MVPGRVGRLADVVVSRAPSEPPTSRVRVEIHDPKHLGDDARTALSREMYDVHAEVFDGVDFDHFRAYVVDSKAEHTRIHLYRGPDRALLGYVAVHVFERVLNGRAIRVLRGEAGSVRAWRGAKASSSIVIAAMLRAALRVPRKPLYFLGSLVHPSSYLVFARFADPVSPRPGVAVPADMRATMDELATSFGLERVRAEDPLVRAVGWRTRDNELERAYWRQSDKPWVQRFLELNPGYGDGHGLVTVVPLTAWGLVRTLAHIRWARFEPVRARLATLSEHLPFVGRPLRLRAIRRSLRAAAFFANLDDAAIAALAEVADVRTMGSGKYVFRQGDRADDAYVVLLGAVYVVRDESGGERMLDQLGPGEVFGELGVLDGAPRTASIRTATACRFVRIPREALLGLMARDASVRDAIWAAYGERTFDNCVRGSERFEGLTREARIDLLHRGKRDALASGARAVYGGSPLFVLSGEIEVRTGTADIRIRAPGFLDTSGDIVVVARSDAQVIALPTEGGIEGFEVA